MNVYFRKDLDDIVNFVLYNDDGSSDESDNEWSSSGDDKDLLLVDKLFPENPSLHVLIPKRNLEDISDEQCEKLFRYVNVIFLYIYIYYRFEVVLFCFILLLAIILFIIY